MLLKKTAISFAAAAFTLTSFAMAQSVTFRYQPDELQTRSGAMKTYKRLEKRVERACVRQGQRTLSERRFAEDCMAELKDQMVAKIDHPRVNQLHARAGGTLYIAGE
ncbi:MAG: UrcA family protein [Pseudomonadota bacterium]